jgi:hypothetical protein
LSERLRSNGSRKNGNGKIKQESDFTFGEDTQEGIFLKKFEIGQMRKEVLMAL